MIKKTICAVLTALVTFCSVFFAYEDTVHAFDIPTAFWGTLEASRALWTGLQTGGALQNGISISQFERSSREDMLNFQSKVLLAYNGFCVYKEKAKLLMEHPDWSMEQITNEATVRGYNDFTSFKNNAIDVNNTTGSITLKDWGYWKEFCKEVKSVAKNGLGSSSSGNVQPRLVNNANYPLSTYLAIAPPENTIVYNDRVFVDKGTVFTDQGATNVSVNFEVPTDRIVVLYAVYSEQFWDNTSYCELHCAVGRTDINRLTGSVITSNPGWQHYLIATEKDSIDNLLNQAVSVTNLPTFLGQDFEALMNFGYSLDDLSLSQGQVTIQQYKIDISVSLDDTEIGKAIKEGGVSIPDIVKDTDVPVKRSSVRVGEETATGVIGWDIPSTDVLEGAIAQPKAEEQQEVIEGIGVISVPEEKAIEGTIDDTVITWDKGEAITVPGVEDQSITTTIDEVISIQGGEYYPGTMDISGFFPFCIPFDIIYLVEKFDVHGANAPVITIPIMYPEIMANQLGTDRYDVIIDFQDFLVLRNILRVFLLIGFIIGLMKFTRDIIRG